MLGKNKMVQPFPAGWEVGSVHIDTVPGYWNPIKFEVIGWYINHVHDTGVHRFIKDGKTYAVKFLSKDVKTVESTLPPVGTKQERAHQNRQRKLAEYGGPRAHYRSGSEVYGW